ncbi:30S ribosomal protein S12 methylthiotransferase accessory factor YcaO [Rhodocyclus tenuis]|uniref:30S ribosomal protein S12 methylthiotransferase accessory factor YcaO n=1 Tax=Rhodocyclus tenuis TaxID=1066 RepID=UPI00190810A9|nr:30S ribosomal protein S12 methylthiotransferase accessory factor YcaO [Rhodocyclus tenuis]MBK1681778.1 30s ribosomal protein S12 methylthiotransferase accessory protein YcaO [Rhodocyclus tenuis]
MPTLTTIAGKDAPLETTIARLQARLAALGFNVEESAWLNPVAGVHSVHLRDRDCPLLFSNGKGASPLAARASALGEFCERLFSRHFWTHYARGKQSGIVHHPQEKWFPLSGKRWPRGLLTPELRRLYDPEGALTPAELVDFNSGDAARGICAIPATRLRDGETVWFPANIVGNLYLSNGIAAGNTLAEARTQALSEVVERHVKFRVLREGLCLPEVPEAVIARHPHLAAGIAALRAAGFGILVRDASLGGRYPVANVTLLHPQDQGCFASFGAHPLFAVALERALTELLQGRALAALAGFPAPGFDADEIASAPNIEAHFVDSSGIVGWSFLSDRPDFEFCDWNFAGDTAAEACFLTDCLHADGHDVYCVDYSQPDFAVCRMLVPGVSEVYPIDDLRWENNRVGAELRPAILALPELADDDCGELLDALNEHGFDDARPIASLIGLAVDAGSFWEDLRVGELKTLLALAIGDVAAIREGCDWVRHFGQIDAGRRRVYQCIETLLGLALGAVEDASSVVEEDGEYAESYTEFALPTPADWAPWRVALLPMFGAATLAQAEAMLAGERRAFGIAAPGEDFAGCALHARLLAAGQRLAAAETAAAGKPAAIGA